MSDDLELNDTNVLLHQLTPFFQCLVLLFQSTDDYFASHSLEVLRKTLTELLTDFEACAEKRSVPKAHIQDAQYALVAFIDELIIRTPSIETHQWITRPLQLDLFGETSAGERFFSRLKELRLQGAASIDVLELYYMCLALGYEGQYRFKEHTTLIIIRQTLFTQIQSIRPFKKLKLCVKPATCEIQLNQKQPRSTIQRNVCAVLMIGILTLVLHGILRIHNSACDKVVTDYQARLQGIARHKPVY